MRRSKQAWLELIQEFEASGLSQTDFCNNKNLNPKYFSLKRSRLLCQPPTSKGEFIKVKPQAPSPSNRDYLTYPPEFTP